MMFKGYLKRYFIGLFVAITLLFCGCALQPAFAATGTLKVSGIEAPNIIHRVGTIAELEVLKPAPGRKSVYLEERGGGVFVWDNSDLSSEVAAYVYQGLYIAPLSGYSISPGDSGAWVRKFTGPVNILWFGNTVTEVSLQAAHNTGRNVFYPAGSYSFNLPNAAIQVAPGQKIIAENGHRFSSDGKRTVTVTNTGSGGGVFWYTEDDSTIQVAAPQVEGFRLVADYPIKFNDRTIAISDGVVMPYLMFPIVRNCYIGARVVGTGYGIDFAKVFDGIIEQNEIVGFDINVLLVGSDMNVIRDNRIINFTSNAILEFSTGTFGSQNTIEHNDILSGGGSTSVYIKSNSRHVRIYNNYLEKPGGTLGGFIDVSATGMPSIFGSNAASFPYTVDVTGNRIDGFTYATNFVYRLNPTGEFHRIIDVGTTSVSVTNGLVIEGDYLPVRYNASHRAHYIFKGEQFGKWNNFETGKSPYEDGAIKWTPQTYAAFDQDGPNANNAGDYTRYAPDAVVILPGHTMVQTIYPVSPGLDGLNNEHFASGETYSVTFYAKTTSSTPENFRLGKILNGAGGAQTVYSLTNQYQKFTFSMTGLMSSSDVVGVYFSRDSALGDIKIKSLIWTQD